MSNNNGSTNNNGGNNDFSKFSQRGSNVPQQPSVPPMPKPTGQPGNQDK